MQLETTSEYKNGNLSKHLNLRKPTMTGLVLKISIINSAIVRQLIMKSMAISLYPTLEVYFC